MHFLLQKSTTASLDAPSTFGAPATFISNCGDGSIYFFPFTKEVLPCAPLSLVSKPIIAFQKALTEFKNCGEDVILQFQRLAIQFLYQMGSCAFTLEQSMYMPLQEVFRVVLSNISGVVVSAWSHPERKKIQSDSAVIVHSKPCIILECKIFDLSSKVNPVLEAIGYFQHMINVYGSANLTCALLVAIVGDLMSIYGCHAFVKDDGDKQLLVELLCPPLSLRFNDSVSWHLDYIASVLYGFVCFVKYISNDTSKLEFCPLTLAKLLNDLCPGITSKGPLRRMCPDKLVFAYETTKNLELVVKFLTGNYGEHVHRHLAANNYAPKLYQVYQLPLNWKAVVMGKVSVIQGKPADYSSQMKQILQCLQKMEYVHGDLREQNILNVNGKLQICDFDWAGVEGTARYPLTINDKDIEWPRENLAGQKILMTDDSWWIQKYS